MRISVALSLLPFVLVSLAHPGSHDDHDVLARRKFLAHATRSIANCAGKIEARGIEARAISQTKGCYVGQEIIIRVLHRGGGRVARRLVGLVASPGGAERERPPTSGDLLRAGEREVGHVTSATWSPRLGGFIAAPASFTQHALVMNGASDLAVEVFGEAGRHARSTIGVPSLPADAAVEVEGMFELG